MRCLFFYHLLGRRLCGYVGLHLAGGFVADDCFNLARYLDFLFLNERRGWRFFGRRFGGGRRLLGLHLGLGGKG